MKSRKYNILWALFIFTLSITLTVVSLRIHIIRTLHEKYEFRVSRDERITIGLNEINDDDLVIYEDDLVQVFIGCDDFLSTLDGKLIDLTEPSEYRAALEDAKNQIENRNSCRDVEITFNEYDIAYMLETGVVSVFDKNAGLGITTIEIRYYDFRCGPLCGEGSRSFYLPDGTLFFKVRDWVS